MSHEYDRLKAGLKKTVKLWEKHHGDETKTQVIVQDNRDNLKEDDHGFFIVVKDMAADGSQEQHKVRTVGAGSTADEAIEHAEEWMSEHPDGLN